MCGLEPEFSHLAKSCPCRCQETALGQEGPRVPQSHLIKEAERIMRSRCMKTETGRYSVWGVGYILCGSGNFTEASSKIQMPLLLSS